MTINVRENVLQSESFHTLIGNKSPTKEHAEELLNRLSKKVQNQGATSYNDVLRAPLVLIKLRGSHYCTVKPRLAAYALSLALCVGTFQFACQFVSRPSDVWLL